MSCCGSSVILFADFFNYILYVKLILSISLLTYCFLKFVLSGDLGIVRKTGE